MGLMHEVRREFIAVPDTHKGQIVYKWPDQNIRKFGQGEKILIEPGGFLYKDSSVTMNTVQQNVKTGLMRHGMYLAEMTGPGRVGIQSMYVHAATSE